MLDIAKERSNHIPNHLYVVGMVCVLCTSWCASAVTAITRYLKDIHFSVIMFYYGLSASIILMVWLVLEYFIWLYPAGKPFRMLHYSLADWSLLTIIAILNAVGMNFATIAGQYEKSSFVTVV